MIKAVKKLFYVLVGEAVNQMYTTEADRKKNLEAIKKQMKVGRK